MLIAPVVHELEALAKGAGVPMSRALAEAGVSLSTWWRWRKDGAEPLPRTVRKVKAAIDGMSQERAA